MQLSTIGNQATMSSLEMVDFINEERESQGNYTKLRHDHLLEKVPKVLKDSAPNFRGVYQDAKGEQRPCYHFPKREACLMAMSYSYDLQAKVFDRMTALEARQSPSLPIIKNPNLALIVQMAAELDALQSKQERQAIELSNVQEEIKLIGARSQPDNEFFSVMGYANLINKRVDLNTAAGIGRKCSSLSRDLGLNTGTVSDPRFGKIKTYHKSVLEAAFNP